VLQQLSYFFGVTATQLFLWCYSYSVISLAL